MSSPDDGAPAWICHAGDVRFAITAPSKWLTAQREYLSGFLTTPPGQLRLDEFNVRIHTDDGEFRQLVSAAADGPTARVEPVPGLVMRESAQPTGQRCYTIVSDDVEHQPGAYAVTAHGHQFDLFTHTGTAHPHRYPIRLIREAMLRTYEDAGGVVFHAAGVDLGGVGVMVCGPRSAGKTTTTAALLRSTDAALLSNDRLVVLPDNRLVAVPLPVPTARGTIEAFPELARVLRCTGQEPARLDALPRNFGSTTKHPFSARQFAQAFGADLTSSSATQLVVVPHLTDTHQPARLRRLSGIEAQRILAANCFTPRDEFWVRPWLVPRHTDDDVLQRHAAAAVGRIAAAVPCVGIGFGVRNPISSLVRALELAAEGVR
jgi:hypothetical protein